MKPSAAGERLSTRKRSLPHFQIFSSFANMTIGRGRLVSATFIHLRAVSGTALLFVSLHRRRFSIFRKPSLNTTLLGIRCMKRGKACSSAGDRLAARPDGLPFISLHFTPSSIESAASRCGRRDTTKAAGPPGPTAFTFLLELDVRDSIMNGNVKLLVLSSFGILRLITQQNFSARYLLPRV